MGIGENIKRIRKEKGYTQKRLGELSGVNEAQIRRYELEKQNSNPKMETLQKIASALEVDVNELYGVSVIIGRPPLNITQTMTGLKESDHIWQGVGGIKSQTEVFSGTPEDAKLFAYASKLKHFAELLEDNSIVYEKGERNGKTGKVFSFNESGEKYFLTDEQARLLPEMSIEQIKALIRSFDQMNIKIDQE